MIRGLRWFSFDFEELANSGATRARKTPHKLDRIFYDWPDAQKESQPSPSALITSPDRATYGASGFRARLLEDTADRFRKDTMLRYLGEQEIPLLLVFWCAHKDQRRGLEAKVGQLLAAERHTDSMGRRIVVPEYFSRTIRYTMIDSERPDAQDSARSNEWSLGFSITAEVPHVELVWSPGTVEDAAFGVEA
jgi:hypothetical protein